MQMDVHQIAAMSDTPSAKALPWWSQTPGHKFALQWAIQARNGSKFHP